MIYKSKYGTYDIELIFQRYKLLNYRIELFSREQGPIAVATANFPGELNIDEVAIRNHSENEGILDWLLNNKIIAAPHYYIKSGFAEYPVCKLLVNPENYK